MQDQGKTECKCLTSMFKAKNTVPLGLVLRAVLLKANQMLKDQG